MTKPVKHTGTGPPHWLGDDVFVQIEKALGLDTPNDRLRGRLDSAVFNYFWFSQHPKANQAAVNKRLKEMKVAADKLRTLIKDPINHAAQHPHNTAAALMAEARKLMDETPPEKMDEVLRAMEDQVRGRAVEHRVEGLILHETDIDVDDLAEKLEQICSFIDAREKSKGGWRGYEFWNELMLEVATIYQEATGKRATVTESEHGAKTGKRYSGTFVDIATIIDEATADSAFTEPRLNSALGPALRRLIEP
jgi:hypothetical protein